MRLSSPFLPLETLCFMGCFKVLLSRCHTLRHKRIALCGEGSKCWVGGGLRLPSGSNPGRKQGWIFQNNTLQRSAPALTFELRTRLKIWSNARSREQRLQSLITHSYHFKHNALATHTHTHTITILPFSMAAKSAGLLWEYLRLIPLSFNINRDANLRHISLICPHLDVNNHPWMVHAEKRNKQRT